MNQPPAPFWTERRGSVSPYAPFADHPPSAALLRWATAEAALEPAVDPDAPARTGPLNCAICFDRPRSVVLMPCGHCYACATCVQRDLRRVANARAAAVTAQDPSNPASGHVARCMQCRTPFTRAHVLTKDEIQRLATTDPTTKETKEREDIRDTPSEDGGPYTFRGEPAPIPLRLSARMPCCAPRL